MNEKRLYHRRSTDHGVDNLMVAIGERAIKDYERALRRYQRAARRSESNNRSIALFRANHRMKEASYFFLADPYDIFPNGGGKQIIALINEKHNFKPVRIPTKDEYQQIMKNLEK